VQPLLQALLGQRRRRPQLPLRRGQVRRLAATQGGEGAESRRCWPTRAGEGRARCMAVHNVWHVDRAPRPAPADVCPQGQAAGGDGARPHPERAGEPTCAYTRGAAEVWMTSGKGAWRKGEGARGAADVSKKRGPRHSVSEVERPAQHSLLMSPMHACRIALNPKGARRGQPSDDGGTHEGANRRHRRRTMLTEGCDCGCCQRGQGMPEKGVGTTAAPRDGIRRHGGGGGVGWGRRRARRGGGRSDEAGG
jgi:hypothetical protein